MTKFGSVYVSDLLQVSLAFCQLAGVTEHMHKDVDKLKPYMCLVAQGDNTC